MPSEPLAIGTRRELFVDDLLIDRLEGGAARRLHHPAPREVILETDRPWEGNMCGFATLLWDGEEYRFYYKGHVVDLEKTTGDGPGLAETHPLNVCLATSPDGIHWQRRRTGHIEFDGSPENNLVWLGVGEKQYGVHGFAPFLDPNPDAAPAARYKAVGAERRATKGDLWAMQSADGIHWELASDEPVLTDHGFDSQNLAFWDALRGEYRVYVRQGREGRRDIKTATSSDFLHWSETEWLAYPGAPAEQLYTNQVLPYHRAPHLYLGFPSRYVERPWSPAIERLPELEHRRLRARKNERFGTAVTDGLFMASRDGVTFRRYGEAFIRPGLQSEGNWSYGDNYQCWGLIETPSPLPGGAPELSFVANENYWRGPTRFRRYTLRLDGFVSIEAPLAGGELVTPPLRMAGRRLSLNAGASAAGSLRVELQEPDGTPLPGYSAEECVEVLGDSLDYTVAWRGGETDLSALAERPLRLRVLLRDADLYSLRFAEA